MERLGLEALLERRASTARSARSPWPASSPAWRRRARSAPAGAGCASVRRSARLGVDFERMSTAPLPRLRCPDVAPRDDRGASVRPGDGSVRPAPHGDALRPDHPEGERRPRARPDAATPRRSVRIARLTLGLVPTARASCAAPRSSPARSMKTGPWRRCSRPWARRRTAGSDGRGHRHRGQHRLAARNGTRYLAVSRERTRRFDPELAQAIETRSRRTVHVHKVVDPDSEEARLYCYSEARAKKERGIANRFAARFEGELKKLHDGLGRPRPARARPGLAAPRPHRGEEPRRRRALRHRRHRRRQRREGAGRHLEAPSARRFHDHPSRRLLPAHQCRGLGRGGAVADLYLAHRRRGRDRSLKSELGLRPIFNQTQRRSDGHLFITVIAYDGADHPSPPRRAGRARQLGQPQSYPRRTAARHRNLPAQGPPPSTFERPHAPNPGNWKSIARSHSTRTRRRSENDRLNPDA